jgi:hypothetical protein
MDAYEEETRLQRWVDGLWDELSTRHAGERGGVEGRQDREHNDLEDFVKGAFEQLNDGSSVEAIIGGYERIYKRSELRNRTLWLLTLLQLAIGEKDSGDWDDIVTRAAEYGRSAAPPATEEEIRDLGTRNIARLMSAGKGTRDEIRIWI